MGRRRCRPSRARPSCKAWLATVMTAQHDCGQCGYDCHNYSEAIASKSEARLNLCVPGGKETARMLKSLYEEIDKARTAPASPPSVAPATVAPAVVEPGRSRDNPAPAIFLGRR